MKCFVIMPFGNPKFNPEHARKLELIYSQWIKPTVESIRLPGTQDERIICHRADKELRPEEIITHIVENLVAADIVIADLSGKNPNVFYELGVRHAVNNNTILIAEDLDDVPFDLRGLRTIIYKYEPEQMLNLKNSLEQAINRILSDPDKIDNPVRRFLYDREVSKLIKEPAPPSYEVFMNLISEMSALKIEFNNHANEVRHIMKLVTATEDKISASTQTKVDLTLFEGVWEDQVSGSTYCARIIDGELFMPYSYGSDSYLTGLYYNCRLIGETLFSRFKWLDISRWFALGTSGYSFLKIESENKLVGGWWFSDDISSDLANDFSRLNDSVPGMTMSILKRHSANKQFPSWAEKYFRKALYKR